MHAYTATLLFAAAAAAPARALLYDPSTLVGSVATIPFFSNTTSTPQAAQPLIAGVSNGCLTGLAGLISRDPAGCLDIGNALKIFGGVVADQSQSVVPAIDQYLKQSVCAKDACVGNYLSSANETLHTTCADSLGSNNGINLPNGIRYVIENYSTLRTAACFQASSGDLCITSDLNNIQSVTSQQLSLSYLMSLLSNATAQQDALKKLQANPSQFCTDCNHALFTQLSSAPDVQGINNSDLVATMIKDSINTTCGASFSDGKYPSNIRNGTAEAIKANNGTISSSLTVAPGSGSGASSSGAGSSSSSSSSSGSGSGSGSTSGSTSGTSTGSSGTSSGSGDAAVSLSAINAALLITLLSVGVSLVA